MHAARTMDAKICDILAGDTIPTASFSSERNSSASYRFDPNPVFPTLFFSSLAHKNIGPSLENTLTTRTHPRNKRRTLFPSFFHSSLFVFDNSNISAFFSSTHHVSPTTSNVSTITFNIRLHSLFTSGIIHSRKPTSILFSLGNFLFTIIKIPRHNSRHVHIDHHKEYGTTNSNNRWSHRCSPRRHHWYCCLVYPSQETPTTASQP